jgi:hypothetical protein
MGKRSKKNSKKVRKAKKRREERIAEVALKKWLAVQESAVLMKQDMGATDGSGNVLVKDEHGFEVKMSGGSVSFGNSALDGWLARSVANALHGASIFIMDPQQYAAYYHEADVYTTEKIAGHPWEMVPEGGHQEQWTVSRADARDHYEKVMAAGKYTPPPDPDRWPFESMWISFGAGVPMDHLQMAARLQRETIFGMGTQNAHLLGQLWTMTERGPLMVEAMEFVSYRDSTGPVVGICWSTILSPEHNGWAHPYDLNPWITNAIHKHLLEFKTFIVEKEWRPNQTRQTADFPLTIVRLPIPKPYYVVKLKIQVIQQGFRSAMPRRKKFEYQHQFKVRGHYRVRIKRGQLPMPADAREILTQRGYTIYTLNEMSQEHATMLLERSIPVKRSSEWLAILSSWVRDHTKGPADGPFVPSVRVT